MQNLGTADRVTRSLAAAILIAFGALAPLSLLTRGALVGVSLYFVATALAGTCLGYKLLGRSTCTVPRRGAT